MGLHYIADDLEAHRWYEQLFVRTIEAVEAYAACWAAFEQFAATLDADAAELADG